MQNLPLYITLVFGLTTVLTIYLFYKATNHSVIVSILLLIWITAQAIIAASQFYTVTDTTPPRFLLLVLPPLFTIIGLFMTSRGRLFIDRLDIRMLTLLHVVRIPVELVLYWLFVQKHVPQLMTFEGRNFDILSGITAPIVLYLGFINKKLPASLTIVWNVICLVLLINIVANAVLSAPSPFQKFAFNQPNVAVLYFPFICTIVPLVLLSHLAAIRQLSKTDV